MNAPSGQNIIVTGPAGSSPATRTIRPGIISVQYSDNGSTSSVVGPQTIVSPQVVAFEVPANGASFNVTANFSTTTSCSATVGGQAPNACAPIVCSGSELGGIVFNDYNADGIKDAGETNGVAGIKVQVYDCQGNKYETTSTAGGLWKITNANIQYPVRVEFSEIPALYLSNSTLQGANSRTSVQFVTSARCDVNLGVNDPLDFCQTNPLIITPCYVMGNPLDPTGTSADADAIVGFPYTNGGANGPKTFMLKADDVGTTWAQAYNKVNKRLFSAATIKRHAGMGPGGLAAIYITNLTNPSSPSTPEFINLAAAPFNINFGSIAANSAP